MNFKDLLKKWRRKKKTPAEKTYNVEGNEDSKSWRRAFERRKHQLTSYLTFWTGRKRNRDIFYMGVTALLVVGIAYIWFNIGVSLSERKFLAEKEKEIEQQIAKQQELQKNQNILEKGAVSVMEGTAKQQVKQEPVKEEQPENAAQQPQKQTAVLTPAKVQAAAEVSWARPVEGTVTARYGDWYFHPILQEWRYETGIDFAVEVGEPVLAAADGVVKEVIERKGMGKIVVIDHGGILGKYIYCFDVGVAKGQKVKKGDQLGIIEKIGEAEPFLHYEMEKGGQVVDPGLYIGNL